MSEASANVAPSREAGQAGAPVIDVAAGLLFRDGKLLITQRNADDHLGGLWEFPGGKRQPGESFADCLRRELREELGIEVDIGEPLETLTHQYPDRTVRLQFLRCRWLAQEPRAIGCQAFAWISREQLTHYAFPAADARLLERLGAVAEMWAKEPPSCGARSDGSAEAA